LSRVTVGLARDACVDSHQVAILIASDTICGKVFAALGASSRGQLAGALGRTRLNRAGHAAGTFLVMLSTVRGG
jgi:hypothetical protein